MFVKRIRLKNCDIYVITDDRKTMGAISIAMPAEVGGRVLSYDLLGSSFEYASRVMAEWLATKTGKPCLVITNVRLEDYELLRKTIIEMLRAVEEVEEDNCGDNGG